MDTNNQYPREVEIVKQLTNSSIVKETHISYAIIGDEFVYKVKKPVDFGFLDYRLAKSRRAFCILEKELNERFSDGVYLEVLKIVNRGNGEFALVDVESSVPAIEYVLKMKRIDDGDFLPERVNAGKVSDDMMKSIGSDVAKLFKGLDNAPLDENFATLSELVKFNAIENFNQTEKYTSNFIDKNLYRFIENATLKFIDDNAGLFSARFDNGYFKNGHGDLRLEHIYFGEGDKIGLIDCIEFNKRFRCNDVIAEAAFLSMEMDYSSQSDLSDSFLSGYLSVFDDADSLKLLNYYRSYYAYVRAKVACFLLDGKTADWELYSAKREEVARLINMSAHYAYAMQGGSNLIFYGLVGTGKTRNAIEFSKKFPVCHISSDYTRKTMANIDPEQKEHIDWKSGIYSEANSLSLYEAMGKLVADKNRIGRLCVVDGSFLKHVYYDTFTSNAGATPYKVNMAIPDNVIMDRLAKRLAKTSSVSDGRPMILEEQKKSVEPLDADLVMDTQGDVHSNVDTLFNKLIS